MEGGNSEAEKVGSVLYIPGKERIMFKPPEKKSSLFGLDALARAKRAESGANSVFKVPTASISASEAEDEETETSADEEAGISEAKAVHNPKRTYRGTATVVNSNAESTIVEGESETFTSRAHRSDDHMNSEVSARSTSSSHITRSRNHNNDDSDHRSRRRDRYSRDSKDRDYGERESDYERDRWYKRNRYESRTPGRSDWDDGRWEWQDTPRRDGSSSSRRQHQPSPSPMLLGASPDMRYPSPWLDSHTPRNVVCFHL